MWPYKIEALFYQKYFCRFKKSVCHLISYVMKTVLSDAEVHEEHNAT